MTRLDLVGQVTTRLSEKGLHAALALLNARTPHRFTGVYRYDGAILRNEALYDRHAPESTAGEDVPMEHAYCALVRERRDSMMFVDARHDLRFSWKPGSPVVSYCGALIRDERGEPYGTLCHFDILRCEPNPSELDTLDFVAPVVYSWLQAAAQDRA